MTYQRASHILANVGFVSTYDVLQHTYTRLAWLYGPQRANDIIAGRDPKTRADIELWTKLSRHGHAAPKPRDTAQYRGKGR